MKRKKRNILIALLIVLLIGAGGAYVGGKLLMRHRMAAWKRDGIAASAAGHHERAAALLGRFLQRNQFDSSVLRAYVTSREQVELPNNQHLAETLSMLRLLVGRDPDNLDERRHLLELYVKLDRWPEALDTANAILAADRWPHDVPTLALKTRVLQQTQDFNEALNTAQAWVKEAPMDINAQMARLRLRAEIGSQGAPPYDAIIADAADLCTAHPNDPRFELLQGYAYGLKYNARDLDQTQRKDVGEHAAEWLNRAAKHPNLSDDLTEMLVAQFDNLGMSNEALAVLQEVIKNGGGSATRHALARRYWQLGNWDKALAEMADVDPKDPAADATLLAFKAICYANLRNAPGAGACRAALAARTQAVARAWTLLLRQIIDAARLDDKQMVTACRAALAADPQNTYLAYYLGDAEARLGDIDVAINLWKYAAFQNPTWNAPAVRLVDAMLQRGLSAEASHFAYIASLHNHSAAFAVALARAYAANVEPGGPEADELLKNVSAIQAQLPGEDRTLLLQINLLAQKNRKDEAMKAAHAALDRTPPHSQAFLLTLAAISRKTGLAIENECFTQLQKAYGLTPQLAYARAMDQSLAGNGKAGLEQFDDIARRAGHASDVNWQLMRCTYLDLSASSGAKAAWAALGDAFPKDISVQQAVVSANAIRGDQDITSRAIDRLHALTGDDAVAWRMAKARLFIESSRDAKDLEQGSVLLNQIIRQYPANTDARVLLARALVQMKRLDGAVEQLSAAVNSDPDSIPLRLQLAALLQSRGDFERVQQELDRAIPQMRSQAQRQQAAILLARQGNTSETLKLLRPRAGDSDANSKLEPPPSLLLAAIHQRDHEPQKAEAIVRKLLEKPDVPTIQFAASMYAGQGRPKDAEDALAKLDTLTLEPGIKELVWGGYLAQSGNLPEAVKRYRAAAEQAPANPATWRMLMAAQLQQNQVADAMATLRDAAKALPADKGFAALQAKSALLSAALRDGQMQPAALAALRDPANSESTFELLRILLDARQSNDVERLASQLKQFTEIHPDSAIAQIQYARCLASMGRMSDAGAAIKGTMNAFPVDTQAAQAAVQIFGLAGRWSDMQSAAQAWKRRAGNDSPAADIAIASAMVHQQQFDAALSQLEPALASAKARPDQNVDLLTVYCVAAVNAGRMSAADELLWPLTAQSSQWRIRWMQVGVEIPDAMSASGWIGRVAARIPAGAAGERVALAETYSRLNDRWHDADLAQKAAELFARIASDPKAPATALLSAGFNAERANDLPRAEALYRKALARDAKLWPAQNNLAMLIERKGGDMKEAAAFARAAVASEPRQATLQDTLAQIENRAGDAKAAAAAEQLATQLDPDNVKWRIRLAGFLLAGGNPAAARQAVEALQSRGLDPRKLPVPERAGMQEELKSLQEKLGIQAV